MQCESNDRVGYRVALDAAMPRAQRIESKTERYTYIDDDNLLKQLGDKTVLKRDDGTVVGQFGRSGRNAGQFHWIHAMAVDAKGNVYTAEVDNAKRIQKFKLTSDALR